MKYLLYFSLFLILLFIYNNWSLIYHQIQCNNIYAQNYPYTQQKIIKNFLTYEECDLIIKEGENYASKYDWTKKRHDNYPTTDNKLNENWNCYNFLVYKIKNKLYPHYKSLFKINTNKLFIDELFIAKYDGNNKNSQKSLRKHIDAYEFSFIIGLNDNYQGGGTRFIKDNNIVKLNKGDIVIFCGQTYHEGLHVHSGIRYILPGFLRYGVCLQHNDDDED